MQAPGQDLDDPTQWLTSLREAYARSLEEGAAHWRRALAAAEAQPGSASALARAALMALETMGPGDPTSLGMSACDALRQHGGAAEIEPLRAVRSHLPGRSGLRDWRVDADHALTVMTARAAGACTCGAEASKGAAPYGAQWKTESETVDPAQYCTELTVRCTRCQSHWNVRREDSYHYPIFSWTRK